MKTRFFVAILIGVVASFVAWQTVLVAAKPADASKGHRRVVIPPRAVEVAPGVFSLGTAMDKGRVVEGYAIITHKKGFGKPTGCNYDGKCQGWEDADCDDCTGGGSEEPDTSDCYEYMAKRAKWKVIEDYIVETTNTRGLSDEFVRVNFALDIDKWEIAAGMDILGDELTGTVDGADLVKPDDKNEVYFADVADAGAIAVTIVWGIFGGPPPFRELVEWDQVYDDVDFDWSEDATGSDTEMDFENIATHELGHSVGLDDLYKAECSEQTMYGWADYGDINKRDLEDGDITGVYNLYN